MTNLTSLTIAEASAKLMAKDFSALELTEAYLTAMEKARTLNAYIVETPDKAREMAKASDARIPHTPRERRRYEGCDPREWHRLAD